jgi:ribosomal protein S20
MKRRPTMGDINTARSEMKTAIRRVEAAQSEEDATAALGRYKGTRLDSAFSSAEIVKRVRN